MSAPRRRGLLLLVLLGIPSVIGCRRSNAVARADAGANEAGVERASTPTPRAEQPEPSDRAEQATVDCGGWVGSSSQDSCLYIWSSCSDDLDRQLRCERAGDEYRCTCIAGLRAPIPFRSADICTRDTGIMSVDRARITKLARDACGFRINE